MKQDERCFLSLIKFPLKISQAKPRNAANHYGMGVPVGTGVFDATGVFDGRRVGGGGTVFVGVNEGSAVGVMISFAR